MQEALVDGLYTTRCGHPERRILEIRLREFETASTLAACEATPGDLKMQAARRLERSHARTCGREGRAPFTT